MSKGMTEQTWGKIRIEALSDGVFAIALTLLVLDIRLPDLARGMPTRDVLHQMRLLGPSFLSFFITFMLGGTALCVTSLVLAWRVLGRKLKRAEAISDVLTAEVSR